MAERDGRLARIDRQSGDPVGSSPPVTILEAPLPCYLFYGLDGDAWGRLVMTGFSCDQLVLYDPGADRWRTVATDPSPRGIVLDAAGNAWVTHTGGTLSRFSREGATLRLGSRVSLASGDYLPSEAIGVALDSLGNVWAISTSGAPSGVGVATRLPADAPGGGVGEPDAELAIGFAPHTQGDLSGASLRGGFAPLGEATHVFTGCPDGGTRWLALHVVVRNGSASRVTIAARHAADVASLPAETFVDLGAVPGEPSAPWPLAFPDGGALEVEARLETAAADGAPRVERVGVEWRCPGPG
jgi:hypothetical protein